MPMKQPPSHPIRHHLPNKPHSSMQTTIMNSFINPIGHSSTYADSSNKFGDSSRRPSIIGTAPVHIEKVVPPSFEWMSAFPVG